MNRTFLRSIFVVGLLLVVAGVGLSRPAHGEVDPFYLSRLRDGEQALTRGDYASAAQNLRIAAFGMLEEPPRLAATLTELAIAETGAGATDDFRGTLQRLQDLEDRFSAYTKAPLTDAQRESFETTVMQRLSEKELTGYGIFAHLVNEKIEQELQLLPLRQRRRALQQRAEAHPDESRWGLELANLETTDGHPKAAIAALDTVLSNHPELEAAHCRRGSLLVDQKNWHQGAEDLSVCSDSATDPKLAEMRLKALIEDGRSAEALAFGSSLDEAVATDAAVSETLASLQQAQNEAAVQTDAGPENSAGTPDAQPEDQTPVPETSTTDTPTISMQEQSSLDDARTMLQSRNASDLQRAFDLVSPIAADHPADRDIQLLAAEIAYRLSRWDESVAYFQQAGGPRDDQYALRFYYAVALFEAGQLDEAADQLEQCLPHLQRTPFVEGYRERILGTHSSE